MAGRIPNILRILFYVLHCGWFGMMGGIVFLIRPDPLADPDFLLAAGIVLPGCVSVGFARRRRVAILIGMPYLLSLAHAFRNMVMELLYVIDHGISPQSTYITFGMILFSAGSWFLIICLFQKSQPPRITSFSSTATR